MKIQQKFFLILFSFSLILVTVLTVLIQWSIGKGMVDYVNTKETEALIPVVKMLANEYKKESNWSTIEGRNNKFRHLIAMQLNDNALSANRPEPNERQRQHRPPQLKSKEFDNGRKLRPQNTGRPPQHRMPPPSLENEPHYVLFDNHEKYVVGNDIDALEYNKTPISIDDVIVGYFAVSKRKRLTEGYELDFIEQQQSYLWIIAAVAMLLVILVTLPLAQHVVEPIKAITRGMHKLTQGDYQQHIDLKRKDELGELGRDYNELAVTLAENETTRKRWLANISHELRTPVAILRGELEAMLDEIRPLTKKNIRSASDELKHLERLINDLHQLTSADIGGMRYRKKNENLTQLLHAETGKYKDYLANVGIALALNLSDEPILIYGDKTRLCQLFENIINNCLKYSSATQMKISLDWDKNDEIPFAILRFEDDGVGVENKHLPHLFEYLYRVDDSRNRRTGGAGLGLSICHHIVVAHQGQITATQASLGGLAITITFPLV